MARTFSRPGEPSPSIDKDAVLNFFEERAKKVGILGATRAVIYQDKNSNLAELRDAAEKDLLYPLIDLGPNDYILDAGCGTGRWAELLIPNCAGYHGVDVSPGLIQVAIDRFRSADNARFSVCSLDNISLSNIRSDQPFTRTISLGVFIYLNDVNVCRATQCIAQASAPHARLLFREPVAVENRLTLSEHYSEDMNQIYNAIYRTEHELLEMLDITLAPHGFRKVLDGDVYQDTSLNNRKETKQRFFLFER